MRKCPSCGFANMDSRETCMMCNASFNEAAQSPQKQWDLHPKAAIQIPFHHGFIKIGYMVQRLVKKIFPEKVNTDGPNKFYLLAGLLGMIPGVGQIYNRQIPKAIVIAGATAALIWLAAHFVMVPIWGNCLIGAAFLMVMISCADSMLTAARMNGQHFTLRNRLAMLMYPLFMVGLFSCFCSIMSVLHWPLFTPYYINRDYMKPAIRQGDRICMDGLTYWWSDPKPGDVVHYAPTQFSIEIPGDGELGGQGKFASDRQLIAPLSGWERVMAVGGEKLECREGIYSVNGRKLSKEYYPLVTGNFYDSFTIECPLGKYVVLSSSLAEDGLDKFLEGGKGLAWKTLDPKKQSGGKNVLLVGWEQSCVVERKAIWGRAWFRYHPTIRRSGFQPQGNRFAE